MRPKTTAAEKANSHRIKALAAERDMWVATRGRLAYDAELLRRRAARNILTRARVAAVIAARDLDQQLDLSLDEVS